MGTIGTSTTKLIASIIDPSIELADTQMITYVDPLFIVEERQKENNAINNFYTGDIAIAFTSSPILGTRVTTSSISTFDKLINTLESYKSLEEDWDGYGGVTPSIEVVDTAINLIFKIKRDDLPTPKPMISSSGNVGLYWNGKDSYVEVGIDGDNSYYTYISEGDKYAGQDNNMLDEPLPDNLTRVLQKLSA